MGTLNLGTLAVLSIRELELLPRLRPTEVLEDARFVRPTTTRASPCIPSLLVSTSVPTGWPSTGCPSASWPSAGCPSASCPPPPSSPSAYLPASTVASTRFATAGQSLCRTLAHQFRPTSPVRFRVAKCSSHTAPCQLAVGSTILGCALQS